MSDNRVNVVWVAGATWHPGGYYHQPAPYGDGGPRATNCGITNINWHGTFVPESEALDDWRKPCADCYPEHVQAIGVHEPPRPEFRLP